MSWEECQETCANECSEMHFKESVPSSAFHPPTPSHLTTLMTLCPVNPKHPLRPGRPRRLTTGGGAPTWRSRCPRGCPGCPAGRAPSGQGDQASARHRPSARRRSSARRLAASRWPAPGLSRGPGEARNGNWGVLVVQDGFCEGLACLESVPAYCWGFK